MTQDQYGQARDSGYAADGPVVEGDQTDEIHDDQERPMTRFQKVASVLRGDRTDRDELDEDAQDQAPEGQVVTSSQTVTGSDIMAPSHEAATQPADVPQDQAAHSGNPPWTTSQDEAGAADAGDVLNAQDAAAPAAQDLSGTRTAGTLGETGSGAERGDYWDTPDESRTGQDQVAAVTHPDVPVADADAGADPLARRDEAAGQDTAAGYDTAAYPQDGAATISDVPVTQAQASAAGAEAPGGAGRHTAAPAQDLHPGEAAGTLDDLGDLAYGKLIPDAADFTAQWEQIQFKFVDDPHASVTEAAEIVAQVTARMEAAIQERQRAIEERQRAIQERQRSLRGQWGEGTEADTETLRATLRMYKAFLDQLVGPKL